ncbi:MAG: DEAD/DEAH box helicase family protein [Christensenellaceae bacterium]|jgi:predicted helicase|nr:DEAD/DEAH box helicase family protein [Christensenellaceae bacterium]
MSLNYVLENIRATSKNTAEVGRKFEILISNALLTAPKFAHLIQRVFLWKDFEFRGEFGSGQDVGIDLVAITKNGEFWAVQCKCFRETVTVQKSDVDKFLATSSRSFNIKGSEQTKFKLRIFIASTNYWTSHAEDSFRNQLPDAIRFTLTDLESFGVEWDKLYSGMYGTIARTPMYTLFDYQIEAVYKTLEYFRKHDRGKLIMACGTGKTLTALHIVRLLAVFNRLVLFCVPSISLISQVLDEWFNQSEYGTLNAICVCSDPSVSKVKTQIEQDMDTPIFSTVDLAYPASTNANTVYSNYLSFKDSGLIVIFSTYQSIDVVIKAQKLGLPQFDVIICDEAHRTTGIIENEKKLEPSCFLKVHENKNLNSKLRLYMTATPRIYHRSGKEKADISNVKLYSMDDATKYGNDIYKISFIEAVKRERLTNYKVIVLTLNEDLIPVEEIRALLDLQDKTNTIKSERQLQLEIGATAKLLGCINAMSKNILNGEKLKADDPSFMKRALVFCQNVGTSQSVAKTFNALNKKFISSRENACLNEVKCQHIDGSMKSSERNALLSWLSGNKDADKCKILSNVRCLTEGIDVPALDAIIFLSPKYSVIDIVQAVGRVMRRAEDKKFGYILIPIIVPSFIKPDVALEDSNKHKMAWDIINALRSHDPTIDEMLHQVVYNIEKPDKLIVGGVQPSDVWKIKSKLDQTGFLDALIKQYNENANLIFGRLVEYSGTTYLWRTWAKNIAEIASRHIESLTGLFESEKYKALFEEFIERLSTNVNNLNLSKKSVIEMLAQHKITEPIFNSLFKNYEFSKHNPIAIELDFFLSQIKECNEIEKSKELLDFYENVKSFAEGIDNPKGRQSIILKLYNSFFKEAFPTTTNNLGIVYTPVEIVDFMLHSVDDIIKAEFNMRLTEKGVNIIDPFTGTGTFVARLLQSNLISYEDLERKYKSELLANEIVLLAYYIATVNIENEFSIQTNSCSYKKFEGICLTDTFQLSENDQIAIDSSGNADRLIKQRKTKVTVIIGNPPYSMHGSHDESFKAIKYPNLDGNIYTNYVKHSTVHNTKSLYDSYIRAFRWATDRIGNNDGIVAFVTNASYLRSISSDGLRKSFSKEFSKIYIYDLRGDRRINGVEGKKEGRSVFGDGTQTPIAIIILVKRKFFKEDSTIYYYAVEDGLSREAKLKLIENSKSFLSKTMPAMTIVHPNSYGDWFRTRRTGIDKLYPLAQNKTNYDVDAINVFTIFSLGITTARDIWCYAFSRESLTNKMTQTIEYYNLQIDSDSFVPNPQKISWNSKLMDHARLKKHVSFIATDVRSAFYKPFCRKLLYFSPIFNETPRNFKSLFPFHDSKNLLICISGTAAKNNFTVLMTDCIVNFDCLDKTRCFPLYYYDNKKNLENANMGLQISILKESNNLEIDRKDAISDSFANLINLKYNQTISKTDIFYYVYALLHSKEYRKTFKDDLQVSFPKIPIVGSVIDFWFFCNAGKELADLHLNYDIITPLSCIKITGDINRLEVKKMKFASKFDERENDQSIIVFNNHVTISNIPKIAYEYVLNGRSAISLIMDYYQLKTDDKSGIISDPNECCKENNNPSYLLNLLLSVISMSVKTVEIINSLPELHLNNDSKI